MDRIEPYIGMPIILGDSDMQMSDHKAAETTMKTAPQTQTMQQAQPAQQNAAQTEETAQQCQPCLTDENCETCARPQMQTMVPGMAYVPWQIWQQPYEYEKGFEVGTIFPDLNLPFLGYQGGRKR